MQEKNIIESYLGVTPERKLSKIPARLDFWQSATGLFLALFMIAHMFFVSSILLGESAMYKVAKFFEGSAFLEHNQPYLVSIVAFIVIVAFVAHAFLALRKFPINYRQFKILKAHKYVMRHSDTSLWFLQAASGFALFCKYAFSFSPYKYGSLPFLIPHSIRSAAVPVTNGTAMEVPLLTVLPPPGEAERISTPGAARSGFLTPHSSDPRPENGAYVLFFAL